MTRTAGTLLLCLVLPALARLASRIAEFMARCLRGTSGLFGRTVRDTSRLVRCRLAIALRAGTFVRCGSAMEIA